MAVGSGCRPRNPEAAQQLVRRLGGERLELPSGCARRADPHAAFQSSAAVPGRRYGRRSRLHRLYVVPIVHIKKNVLKSRTFRKLPIKHKCGYTNFNWTSRRNYGDYIGMVWHVFDRID